MILLLLLGLMTSLFLSAFFSGSESGFYFISKDKLSLRAAQGEKKAERLLKLIQRPGEIISTMLIGNNVALQMGTTCGMLLLLQLEFQPFDLPFEVLTTLVLFLPFFVMGEVMPKATYRLYAEELLLRTDTLIQIFRIVFYPLTLGVKVIAKGLELLFGVSPVVESRFDRQHLSKNLGHAFSDGELSEEQVESLSQVMNASHYPVERVMVPLMKSPLVPVNAKLDELKSIYLDAPQKAYPVYEGKKGNIVGTVNVHRLATRGSSSDEPIRDYLVPKITIESGKAFNDVLPLFFEQNASLVFVTKENRVIGTISWKRALLLLLR